MSISSATLEKGKRKQGGRMPTITLNGTPLPTLNQEGLKWETRGIHGPQPHWTRKPDAFIIESLVRKHLCLEFSSTCEIKLHDRSPLTRSYKITTEGGEYLFKAYLPADPEFLVASEVATLGFLGKETGIPTSSVLAFSDNRDGDPDSDDEDEGGVELGFEWTLQSYLPGVPLRQKWRSMNIESKKEIVRSIARFQAELFGKKFQGVGNLYFAPKLPAYESVLECPPSAPPAPLFEGPGLTTTISPPPPAPVIEPIPEVQDQDEEPQEWKLEVSRIVSTPFLLGDHITYNLPRGPFRNSREWFHARLSLILKDQASILANPESDEDDMEEALEAQSTVGKLFNVLEKTFPVGMGQEYVYTETVLSHGELSVNNILVDEDGKVSGVQGWECVSTVPLWRACSMPEFLDGPERPVEPQREKYAKAAASDGEESASDSEDEPEKEDDEGINSLYWIHYLEWEQTVLRKTFLEEMMKLEPEWIRKYIRLDRERMVDFECAVEWCSTGWFYRLVGDWADSVDRGERWRLREERE